MVRCGQCNKEFKDREACLKHVCEVTGVVQTDPKSMGENFKAIQEAALKRGLEQK
jgi:uncharacterized C2H2 Zn-finger protein